MTVCIVCKQPLVPGQYAIRVPVLCRVEQSTRDLNRFYLNPVRPEEADLIHFTCLLEYMDPSANEDVILSLREKVREEIEDTMRAEIREEIHMEAHDEMWEEVYDHIMQEFEGEDWLTPKYYEDHR